MPRSAWLFAALLILVVSVSEYFGYRDLKEMRAEIHGIRQDVNEATKTIQEESAAVAASSKSAQEAAAKAAIAAENQRQAETSRQQAETSRQQAEAAAEQANAESQAAQLKMAEMQRERQAELDQMQQALNRVVETHRTPNGMVISLPNSVFRFDFDKSDLNPHNRELLSRIAGILLASKGYGLSVFGYTDDIGTADYNQQLSLRRAGAVRDYLVQAGLDPSIINVKGYGKTSPLVESINNESRARNRRVEIALTDSSVHF